MTAGELTAAHAGHLITWQQNGVTHTSRPVSIEHAHGWTYLEYEGEHARAGYAHVLRDGWEVSVGE